MSESFPQTPEETTAPVTERMLHGESVEIPEGQVLHDLKATRSQCFNGAMVTELVLPAPVASGSDIDKRVALIDFGEDAETTGKAVLYYPDTQKELTALGITRTRYGLVTLNYHPEDRMAGIVPLRPGRSETIGRDKDNRNNYLLGLLEGYNQDLSKTQATVTVNETGTITIEDHSTNGTTVVLPAVQ